VQYYTAPHSQYRFFQRLAQAFVRVGLLDQTGTPNSYMPGAAFSVKEAVSQALGFQALLVGLLTAF
jgi:hypothetical protein